MNTKFACAVMFAASVVCPSAWSQAASDANAAPAATASAGNATSSDPFVKRRDAIAAANDEYKKKVAAAQKVYDDKVDAASDVLDKKVADAEDARKKARAAARGTGG